MKTYRKPSGWKGEPYRHYLAAKGVPTKPELKRWRQNVNMSPRELKQFIDSSEGKRAGLSRAEAAKEGVRSGRDSARAILRMKAKPVRQWTDDDIEWMRRQNSFVARMRSVEGPLYDDKGRPTRKLLALKIWGHDPEKKGYYAKKVDLNKYAGTWKQVSVNKEPWYQRGLKDVTATYKSRPDGKITVINKGVTEQGKVKVAKGVARSISEDNRKLKVSFAPFGLFEGDYNIKQVDPNYTRATVQSGKTVWKLKKVKA